VREGSDITIAAYGDMVFEAIDAADRLAARGIRAEVLDLYSIKPVDWAGITASISKTHTLLVVENHQARNGLGTYIGDALLQTGASVRYDHVGLEDRFAESGDYRGVIETYGLCATNIEAHAKKLLAANQGR